MWRIKSYLWKNSFRSYIHSGYRDQSSWTHILKWAINLIWAGGQSHPFSTTSPERFCVHSLLWMQASEGSKLILWAIDGVPSNFQEQPSMGYSTPFWKQAQWERGPANICLRSPFLSIWASPCIGVRWWWPITSTRFGISGFLGQKPHKSILIPLPQKVHIFSADRGCRDITLESLVFWLGNRCPMSSSPALSPWAVGPGKALALRIPAMKYK